MVVHQFSHNFTINWSFRGVPHGWALDPGQPGPLAPRTTAPAPPECWDRSGPAVWVGGETTTTTQPIQVYNDNNGLENHHHHHHHHHQHHHHPDPLPKKVTITTPIAPVPSPPNPQDSSQAALRRVTQTMPRTPSNAPRRAPAACPNSTASASLARSVQGSKVQWHSFTPKKMG